MKLGIDLSNIRREHRGGKDEVAFNLIKGFVSLGHTEEIVCFCRKEIAPRLREIDPGIRIAALPDDHSRTAAGRVLNRFLLGFRLRDMVSESDADVLLFSDKYTPDLRFPVKTAMITHDLKCFEKPLGKLAPFVALRRLKEQRQIRNDFKNRDLVVAISDFDASMCRKYIPEYAGKVRRIYNPVAFPDLSPESEASFREPRKGKYITALNIQWSHKNPMTLLRAFDRVKDTVPLDVVLAGRSSPDQEKLLEYVALRGLQDRVIFTGFVPDEKLQEIIRETRIYVNPSFFEGFGLTAVEMLYQGIPTIVAGCSASPETTAGYADTYFPPDDDAALAERILKEWTSPVPPEKRLEASLEMKKRYNRIKIAAQYWETLSELAAGAGEKTV